MDSSSEFNDLEWAIGLNRRMLKIIGLWPEEVRNQSREELLSKIRLLFTVIVINFLLIPSLMSLIRVWGDMILMIDNLQYTLPALISILKVFTMWYKKKALSSLINMIVKDWMRVKLEEERNVMLKQARIIRFLTICGEFMILFTVIVFITCLVFGRTIRYVTNLTDPTGKPFPIPTYYIHDVSNSLKYELTYLMQIIAIIVTGFTYTAVDSFLGLLILHICGQMENLHLRLLNFGKVPNFETILKYNVKDHIRLIRSVEIIANTFNVMLLGLLFLFGILFCLYGFLIINVVDGNNNLSFKEFFHISAIVCMLMHTCLYCAIGEHLVTQSDKIHRATYEYTWYTLEPKASKNLILIMLRAEKSLYITAGKIFPMTMSTFCTLLKTSAGYISVLLAHQD